MNDILKFFIFMFGIYVIIGKWYKIVIYKSFKNYTYISVKFI